ncbi:TPA: homogentisate 1,2-dioxygenase [Legionella pneumophila]|nr:homogentisate 1,2-dioxygenase [Legionella pneumophila]HAU1320875.1 homogentisate 1,2-dioxygenase [Legionella pneumophila]HBC0466617.1 homogentisate 1,2-dioxygenase [Legionella pneumophila]HBD9374866.1 homogentisate 1,2-dioxygenase [Legionella pneumophila]HBI2946504.1 homogentisate 1,2-dioxygenase [Legionella pneumophila]
MYLQGFGNYHHSEAVKGALPPNQNSPQRCNLGLYAEQLSGTSFTRPRHNNLRSWLYRILPTVTQGTYYPFEINITQPFVDELSPNAMRWSPLYNSSQIKCDFVEGLFHIAGSPLVNAYTYYCNHSMSDKYFADNDGELLFVPYAGEIQLHTEFGKLMLSSGSIAVIPRGVKFKVEVISKEAKGYLCENSGNPLTLPQLGPIGANGLANPRHFQYPVAAFEESKGEHTIICKNQKKLWFAVCNHSPLNVVAWHGNYAPYCYDLGLFNTINTVSFDHPDPSIFTVLTSESEIPGVSNLDFVIFPPRWMVAEHTFRPPYFHRNYMNELMGLVYGEYDAKKEGFTPGGISIHNCMTPHGPDYESYEIAASQELKPNYINSLAFMFETKDYWQVTEQAYRHPSRQMDYLNCWQGFKIEFSQ